MASIRSSGNSHTGLSTKFRRQYGVPGGSGVSARTEDMTEEVIDAERSSLVLARQNELERVLDRHDNFVREAFHMERFVSMLAFDPKIAKEDNSNVFKEYKTAKYDIIEKTRPASTSTAASRKTRRAHTEQLQQLQQLKGSTATPSTSHSTKPKGKAYISQPGIADIWSILASAKGKGKEKELPVNGDHTRSHSKAKGKMPMVYDEKSSSISTGRRGKDTGKGKSKSISAYSHITPKNPLLGSISVSHYSDMSISAPIRTHKRPPDSISINGSPVTVWSPRKRRKTEASHVVDDGLPFPDSNIPLPNGHNHASRRHLYSQDLAIDSGASIEKKTRIMPTRAATHRPAVPNHKVRVPPNVNDVVAPPPPKFMIKRIKLLVRPPPPSLSSPLQRPLLAKHGSSLTTFLDSYVTLNDNDVAPEVIDDSVSKDAAILERIDSLRKHGRLLLGTDFVSVTQPKRQPDHWDSVIDSVITRGSKKTNGGRQVAKQIAGKIQAYWDGFAAREDKAKVQEEKRLRSLAKATIKAVVNEWKKAVFHIREQERLRLQAEEMRRGHEHLDAILDQSGQILETQQGDLTKGDSFWSRSRSSSVSASVLRWDSGEVEDDDEESSREEEMEEGGGDGSENEENEDDRSSRGGEEEDMDNAPLEDQVDMDSLGGEPIATARISQPNSLEGTEADHTSTAPEDHDDDDDQWAAEDLLPGHSSPSPRSSPAPTRGHSAHPVDMSSDVIISPSPSLRSGAPDSSAFHHNAVLVTSPDDGRHIVEDVGEDPDASLVLADIVSSAYQGRDSEDKGFSLPSPSDITSEVRPELVDSPHENLVSDDLQPSFTQQSRDMSDTPVTRTQAHEKETDRISGSEDLDVHHEDGESDHGDVGPSARGLERRTSLMEEEEELGVKLGTQPDLAESTPAEGTTVPPSPAATGIDDDRSMAVEGLEEELEDVDQSHLIPDYLKPYAVAPVEWDPETKVTPPLLLRGVLRPYQQSGLEWLASLHTNNLNGILADEMGLGKTIQTIALLAHLACDRGIWGPHLIVVPTSVLLNWEMEFKKFLPGFKILSYHGSTKRRKELRQGWNDKQHFNVCITSYTLASRDAHIFKRKAWYYMILDEAHMIKNFKSQRWNILLMFRSFRRLLLTGTPLQNNLTELWALLQFLMSGTNFANLKEFGEWFSNPLEKAIEMGTMLDDETLQRVSKLHTVLRPYLLRRLKRDVEKELPSKYEHLVLCPLSKRQRFLYDEFMSRAQTRDALQSGVYQKIANILMQLRKVCNHPDLFEVRPIVTSFAMERSAIADFEIQELLVRRLFLKEEEQSLNLDVLGLQFIDQQDTSLIAALETKRLDASSSLPFIAEKPGEPPLKDLRTIAGFHAYSAYQKRAETIARWAQIGYLNRLRCSVFPIYSLEMIALAKRFHRPLVPLSSIDRQIPFPLVAELVSAAVKSHITREQEMTSVIDKFTFVTPTVVARDLPRIAISDSAESIAETIGDLSFDAVLHRACVKLQIAFPDPSLLQYDCGKLQELTRLLRQKKAGGHRVLIFTQMTKILDILEIFLNFHGYLYLRLDGATKIEDRQYITERFNADSRVFCFIASSRSGGVGINLTGADTVVFYDSDFNPQMDRQCEDRAHRIGQIRDVHIYRFISQHTVEEAMLRKANQKRSLDDLVIQKGEFDWRSLFGDELALTKALGECEDTEDAHAAAVAAREEVVMEGADEADFGGEVDADGGEISTPTIQAEIPGIGKTDVAASAVASADVDALEDPEGFDEDANEPDEEGGTTVDYMLSFIRFDIGFFTEWRL